MRKRTFILSLVATSILNLTLGFSQGTRKAKTNLKIYPVKYSKRDKAAGCFDYNGSCLLPLSKKPTASFENVSFEFEHGAVKFFIDEKTEKSLERAARKYDKLALVHNGKVLHAANVKEIISGDGFKMNFRHTQNFEHLLEKIAG